MKTTIRKLGDSVIVTVVGTLSHDNQIPFRDQISRILPRDAAAPGYRKIIFDFDGLDFVGSSGISAFAATLREVGNRNAVEFRNLQREFKQVFRALDQTLEQFFFDDIGDPRSEN